MSAQDWSQNLAEYLAGMAHGKLRDKTQKSITSYLKPWVEHLEENGRDPTSLLIKDYLLAKRYNHDSYKKIGTEIVLFCNTYMEDELRLIKTKGLLRTKGKVQMPKANLELLLDTVKTGIKETQLKEDSTLKCQILAKYLGK